MRFLLPLCFIAALLPAQDGGDTRFDLLITGGRILDGSGNPWFMADVGIRGGRIVAVGRVAHLPAKRKLDATGRIVAPGFIDIHSHAERGLSSRSKQRRAATNLVTQGITTVVVNQDGRSPAPIRVQRQRYEELGIGVNAMLLVGHGTVRQRVMKRDYRRAATPQEITAMRALIRGAMEDGASGLSAGLEYPPGRWSTREEMVALVSELAPFGGIYIAHERSSGADPMWYLPSQDPPGPPTMFDNVLELIEVAERTGVTVVATHIKVKGVKVWGAAGALIRLIESARARGVSIYADQYPYNTSGTDGNVVLIPAWLRAKVGGADHADTLRRARREVRPDLERDVQHEILRRGGPDQIVVMDHPQRGWIGKTLAALARQHGISPLEMAFRLQLEGNPRRRGGGRLRGYSMSEDDVEAFAARNWTATCTDGGIALPEDGPVHPRFYGAFPRKIRRYAIERGVLHVPDAVRSCTSLPAQMLGLRDRGMVSEGQQADLVVFDLRRLHDHATAFEPHRYCSGIDAVLVNGRFVVEGGKPTGALPGRLLVSWNRSSSQKGR